LNPTVAAVTFGSLKLVVLELDEIV
jgi:hypothetical protein